MARSEDSLMTAEERRLATQKRRRLVLILGLVFVLSAIVYFGARPVRNAIKGWQSRRHAHTAFALIDESKWTEARAEATAAFQLRPTEPEALRAVARFLSRTRQSQAFEFWDKLAEQQKLTVQDGRDLAAVALSAGENERATRAVQQLIAGKPEAADWILAAQLAMQKHASDEAHAAAQKVLSDPRANEREQLQAALLEVASAATSSATKENDDSRAAWSRVEKIARSPSAAGLDALVVLTQALLAKNPDTPRVTDLSAPELSDLLQKHPLAKAPQHLLAFDLLMQADPAQKDPLIARAIENWKDADSTSLATLATWLNGKGEFQRTLDTVPLEHALQTRELFLQQVDALGALGRWDEIKRLLESERFPLDPVIQRMYLARCNAQLGNEAAAANNWERALEAASGDAGKLMTLAEYAEKNGALATAAAAYAEATAAAPNIRPAWQGKLRTTSASRDTARIHAVLAEMLALWPNDTAIQNDEAYMRLLLLPNDQPASPTLAAIEQLADRLVKAEPASLPHRTLLALVLLKEQRPVAALQVYENVSATPNALSPSALAVHAAVLAANERREEARTEIQQAPAEKLLPEEQAGTADLR